MEYMQVLMLTSMQNKANLLEDLSKKRTEQFVLAEEQIMKDKQEIVKTMDQLEREIALNELQIESLKNKNQEFLKLHKQELENRKVLLKKVKEFQQIENLLDGFDKAHDFLYNLKVSQQGIQPNSNQSRILLQSLQMANLPSPHDISPTKSQKRDSDTKTWTFDNYSFARSNTNSFRGSLSPKKSKKSKPPEEVVRRATKRMGLFFLVFPQGPEAFVDLVLTCHKIISLDSKLKSNDAFNLLETLKERNRDLHLLQSKYHQNVCIETTSNENHSQYQALLEYFGAKSNLAFSVHPTILKSIYERILSLFVASRKLFDRHVHLLKRIISQIRRSQCLTFEASEVERIVLNVEQTTRDRERSIRGDVDSPSVKLSISSNRQMSYESAEAEYTDQAKEGFLLLPHIKSTLSFDLLNDMISQIRLMKTLPQYCSVQLANSMIADNLVMVFVRPFKLTAAFPGALNHSAYETLTQDIIGSILGIAHAELLALVHSKLRGTLKLLEMMQRRTSEMVSGADHKPFPPANPKLILDSNANSTDLASER